MCSFFKDKINLSQMSVIILGSIAKISAVIMNKNDVNCEVRKNDGQPMLNSMGSVSSTKKVIMPVTREIVESMIASDTVVIFSKTFCPYCKMAKEVFDKLEKSYTAYELDKRDDADEIQAILAEITGARTVPRVFVHGKCLGGGTDVKHMLESGELMKKFDI